MIKRRLKPGSFLSALQAAYHIAELRRSQYKPTSQLREIQLKRLKTMVRFAYKTIPYYTRLFNRAGFHPDDLKLLHDLRKIPVTTKQDVRDHFSELVPGGINPKKHTVHYTSGSTGIPLKIVKNAHAEIVAAAMKIYAFMECGVSLRHRFVTIGSTNASGPAKVLSLDITQDPDMLIQQLRKIAPDVIYSYSSCLAALAGRNTSGIAPDYVFSQGAQLTLPDRKKIEAAFDVKVLDTYGSREFSRLAFECREFSNLHMITHGSVIEVLDGDEPACYGKSGRIIVTDLYNDAMPLIRYQLEENGTLTDEMCPCGRGWPLLKSIDGRHVDVFNLPGGRKMNPGFVYGIINSETSDNLYCIDQFQLVQTAPETIIFKIVKGKSFDPLIVGRIVDKMNIAAKAVDETMSVKLQLVDQIKKEKNGKIRLIISMANDKG